MSDKDLSRKLAKLSTLAAHVNEHGTPPTLEFKPGARVRYRFNDRDTGTIERRAHGKRGDWYVRWDHDPHAPRLLEAFEENMELIAAA